MINMIISYRIPTLFLISLIILLFTIIRSEDSFSSILNINFNNINDDILKNYKDFDFVKDKQRFIIIKDKIKKVSCLNLINNAIKEINNETKNKLKEIKIEDKENIKIFIKNITNNCINKIKDDEIYKILDYKKVISNENYINNEILNFNEFFSELIKQNEFKKKVKESEIEKSKKQYRTKMIIYAIIIIIVSLIISIIFNKRKKNENIGDENKINKSKKNKNKKN